MRMPQYIRPRDNSFCRSAKKQTNKIKILVAEKMFTQQKHHNTNVGQPHCVQVAVTETDVMKCKTKNTALSDIFQNRKKVERSKIDKTHDCSFSRLSTVVQ